MRRAQDRAWSATFKNSGARIFFFLSEEKPFPTKNYHKNQKALTLFVKVILPAPIILSVSLHTFKKTNSFQCLHWNCCITSPFREMKVANFRPIQKTYKSCDKWGGTTLKSHSNGLKSRTQKKYLIESKRLFVWNTFFDVKKSFVLMKQNLFDSNKISLDQINICSNQINFCLK